MLLDRPYYFAEIKIDPLSLNYQQFHFAIQQTLSVAGPRLGNLSDHRSDSGVHFEPALLDQMLYNFMGCIRMDFEFNCKCTNRRKCLARLKLTADERPFDGKHELIKDGFARMQIEAE